MKPLSILILTHLFPNSSNRKLGSFVRNKAVALAETGGRVTVVAPVLFIPAPLRLLRRYRERYVPESGATLSGIEVHHPRYLRPPGAWFRRHEGRSIHRSSRRLIRELHRKRDFDVVIGGMLTNDGQAAFLAGRDLGIPSYSFAIGSDIHTYPKADRAVERLTRNLLGELAGIFAVGPHFADQIRADYPEFRDRIHCNPFGVDVSRFRPAPFEDRAAWRRELGLDERKPVALFVGDLVPSKGVPEILALIPRVRDLEAGFVFVGRGSLLETVRNAVRTGGKAFDSCRVFDYLGLEELVRCYQNADLFLFPSHFEGSPTVLMEAVASGLPVLASDIPPNHDAVVAEGNGRFFPVGDLSSMEAAFRSMITSPDLAGWGIESRRRALEFFDARLCANQLLKFLTRSLPSGGSGSRRVADDES